MICLGIESTAHTFGAGICDENKIYSNIRDSYKPDEGGIHPRLASDHHAAVSGEVVRKALSEAGLLLNDVDLVAFSNAPGLGPCLRIGAATARTIALMINKPLIPVNHCIAHIEVGRRLLRCIDPVTLYVSGANTQIIAYQGGVYRVFAETLDMGVGNFIDSFARYAGIPFPGGPFIEDKAKQGHYVKLPYVIKGMDVSLTGILTNLRDKLNKYKFQDLCYSLQETVFAMLVEVSERALAHTQKNELLFTGGVAANSRLREMCGVMCSERGAKLFVPDKQYCVDNGAMIAVLGLKMHESGIKQPFNTSINQKQRTDQVIIKWR